MSQAIAILHQMHNQLNMKNNRSYLIGNGYSGILPVNAHAEVNILNLNYITALYFILLPLYCQITCTTINNRGACCNICFKALYFHNLSVLSAVFTANRKYQ